MADPAAAPADPYTDLLGELRGPLVSIQSYVRTLIARDAELSSSARQTIHQVILQHSTKLDGVIDDVVLYARLVSGQVPTERERFLLLPVLEDMRRSLDEPDRVVLTIEPTLIVDADRKALPAAVRRLVRNSQVYGPRRESVLVLAESTATGVEVTVRDNGRGIPQDRLADSKRAFVRAVGVEERRRDGVGLGLAIADQLARQCGGRLDLRNDEPGFSAVLSLPAAPATVR